MSLFSEPHGYPLFRIQLHQIQSIRCHISNKRNKMPLFHGMADCYGVFMIHCFHTDRMVSITFFSFCFRQSDPAA